MYRTPRLMPTKRKLAIDRSDPVKSRKPDPPLERGAVFYVLPDIVDYMLNTSCWLLGKQGRTSGGGQSLAAYMVKQMAVKRRIDKVDPREVLLKHADVSSQYSGVNVYYSNNELMEFIF